VNEERVESEIVAMGVGEGEESGQAWIVRLAAKVREGRKSVRSRISDGLGE
jgi:hypothetical protein